MSSSINDLTGSGSDSGAVDGAASGVSSADDKALERDRKLRARGGGNPEEKAATIDLGGGRQQLKQMVMQVMRELVLREDIELEEMLAEDVVAEIMLAVKGAKGEASGAQLPVAELQRLLKGKTGGKVDRAALRTELKQAVEAAMADAPKAAAAPKMSGADALREALAPRIEGLVAEAKAAAAEAGEPFDEGAFRAKIDRKIESYGAAIDRVATGNPQTVKEVAKLVGSTETVTGRKDLKATDGTKLSGFAYKGGIALDTGLNGDPAKLIATATEELGERFFQTAFGTKSAGDFGAGVAARVTGTTPTGTADSDTTTVTIDGKDVSGEGARLVAEGDRRNVTVSFNAGDSLRVVAGPYTTDYTTAIGYETIATTDNASGSGGVGDALPEGTGISNILLINETDQTVFSAADANVRRTYEEGRLVLRFSDNAGATNYDNATVITDIATPDITTIEGVSSYLESFDANGDGVLSVSELTNIGSLASGGGGRLSRQDAERIMRIYGTIGSDGSGLPTGISIATDLQLGGIGLAGLAADIISPPPGKSPVISLGTAPVSTSDGIPAEIIQVSSNIGAVNPRALADAVLRQAAQNTGRTVRDIAVNGMSAAEFDKAVDTVFGDADPINSGNREAFARAFGALRPDGNYAIDRVALIDMFVGGAITVKPEQGRDFVGIKAIDTSKLSSVPTSRTIDSDTHTGVAARTGHGSLILPTNALNGIESDTASPDSIRYYDAPLDRTKFPGVFGSTTVDEVFTPGRMVRRVNGDTATWVIYRPGSLRAGTSFRFTVPVGSEEDQYLTAYQATGTEGRPGRPNANYSSANDPLGATTLRQDTDMNGALWVPNKFQFSRLPTDDSGSFEAVPPANDAVLTVDGVVTEPISVEFISTPSSKPVFVVGYENASGDTAYVAYNPRSPLELRSFESLYESVNGQSPRGSEETSAATANFTQLAKELAGDPAKAGAVAKALPESERADLNDALTKATSFDDLTPAQAAEKLATLLADPATAGPAAKAIFEMEPVRAAFILAELGKLPSIAAPSRGRAILQASGDGDGDDEQQFRFDNVAAVFEQADQGAIPFPQVDSLATLLAAAAAQPTEQGAFTDNLQAQLDADGFSGPDLTNAGVQLILSGEENIPDGADATATANFYGAAILLALDSGDIRTAVSRFIRVERLAPGSGSYLLESIGSNAAAQLVSQGFAQNSGVFTSAFANIPPEQGISILDAMAVIADDTAPSVAQLLVGSLHDSSPSTLSGLISLISTENAGATSAFASLTPPELASVAASAASEGAAALFQNLVQLNGATTVGQSLANMSASNGAAIVSQMPPAIAFLVLNGVPTTIPQAGPSSASQNTLLSDILVELDPSTLAAIIRNAQSNPRQRARLVNLLTEANTVTLSQALLQMPAAQAASLFVDASATEALADTSALANDLSTNVDFMSQAAPELGAAVLLPIVAAGDVEAAANALAAIPPENAASILADQSLGNALSPVLEFMSNAAPEIQDNPFGPVLLAYGEGIAGSTMDQQFRTGTLSIRNYVRDLINRNVPKEIISENLTDYFESFGYITGNVGFSNLLTEAAANPTLDFNTQVIVEIIAGISLGNPAAGGFVAGSLGQAINTEVAEGGGVPLTQEIAQYAETDPIIFGQLVGQMVAHDASVGLQAFGHVEVFLDDFVMGPNPTEINAFLSGLFSATPAAVTNGLLTTFSNANVESAAAVAGSLQILNWLGDLANIEGSSYSSVTDFVQAINSTNFSDSVISAVTQTGSPNLIAAVINNLVLSGNIDGAIALLNNVDAVRPRGVTSQQVLNALQANQAGSQGVYQEVRSAYNGQ